MTSTPQDQSLYAHVHPIPTPMSVTYLQEWYVRISSSGNSRVVPETRQPKQLSASARVTTSQLQHFFEHHHCPTTSSTRPPPIPSDRRRAHRRSHRRSHLHLKNSIFARLPVIANLNTVPRSPPVASAQSCTRPCCSPRHAPHQALMAEP